MKAVIILSGGMDSTTMAYYLKKQGYNELLLISFDYGQRQKKELNFAAKIASHLNAPHHIINLTSLKPLLTGSSLTDDSVEMPHGSYKEESMAKTVVPNRNAIMLSMAWAAACSASADVVAFGAHGGDHFIYPDCKPDFLNSINGSFQIGSLGSYKEGLKIIAPFMDIDKTEIAKIGHELNVPFEDTWTCYEGGELHCGLCGSCNERKEAFRDSGITDPTKYAN